MSASRPLQRNRGKDGLIDFKLYFPEFEESDEADQLVKQVKRTTIYFYKRLLKPNYNRYIKPVSITYSFYAYYSLNKTQ